jgi:hypothetical protein
MRKTSRASARCWDEFLKWNDAVADVIYPLDSEATPAYMDLEAAELRRIAEHAGYVGSDPRQQFAQAVRAVTVDSDGVFTLGALAHRTRSWTRQRTSQPPPCLAFLGATVLAAEDMGNSEEDLAGHAYYARLARIIGLADNNTALRQQYPKHAEFLWRCLNKWLEDLDGERGLPTAYALTHRYIGLPMSQALVREGDRRKFPFLFAQFGLSPGMQVAPEDLIRYLGHWLTTEGSPASSNLRRLWSRPASHERIASVAAVELANWDGVVEASAPGTQTHLAARAVVVANLRTGFMDSSLDLSLGIRPVGAEMDGQMEVRSTDGSWLPLGFSPGTAGLWRTAYTEAIDFRSMLEGLVRFRHAGKENDAEYKHFPRMVVPLIYDELQSGFVEAERLQLGVDALLLVRSTTATKSKANVADEVEQILAQSARPGFQRLGDLTGLPEGWVLFNNVQLFGAPSADTKYNELLPLARNQLTIAGGLRIPSRIRKWSTHSRPEIRATVQSETRLRVTLTDSKTEEAVCEWESNTGVLVASLADIELDDGDYQVGLFIGSKTTPVQQASIRLRSSKDVDVLWSAAPRLVYSLSQPLGAFSASEGNSEDVLVDGVLAEGLSDVTPEIAATSKVIWSHSRTAVEPTTIKIGTPDPKSCVVTGAHYIVLPTWRGGNAPKFIQGECKSCGLVKRFPGWLPRYGARPNRQQTPTATHDATTVMVQELATVNEQAGPDWDAALDSLMHMGGGPISSLQSLAMQLEGSALFVDNFIRALEALGHIAVERDERWSPTRWEISPSCLSQGSDTAYRLVGFWPTPLREEIEAQVSGFGGRVRYERGPAGPTSVFITGVNDDDAPKLNDDDASVTLAATAGSRILEVLPRLSEVADALPRMQMPGYQSADRFEVKSASWAPTGDPAAPGAYRIRRGFETTYLYRSDADVESGLAAVAPFHLSKHLAANARGKTLVGYRAESRTLLLPQGCDLPVLYGRGIIAMAGCLPSRKKVKVGKETRICLMYIDVDRDCADLLVTLLST